jgi:hypothetical protein
MDDNIIDDSNDFIHEIDNFKLFVILRSEVCKNIFMVKMINRFGSLGGFEKILERLKNENKWCPIELATPYIAVIG